MNVKNIADLILKECLLNNYDGIVLETPIINNELLRIVGTGLHLRQKVFILVISPHSVINLESLVEMGVDRFSLMTYDYSHTFLVCNYTVPLLH